MSRLRRSRPSPWSEVTLPGEPPEATVDLRKEGDGRYAAYLIYPGQATAYVGTVLGGARRWSAEPTKGRPAFHAASRVAAARYLGALEIERRKTSSP